MKRSKMVDILNKARMKMPEGLDLTSSSIIRLLEQNGMLPPEISDDSHHPESSFVNEWEEE